MTKLIAKGVAALETDQSGQVVAIAATPVALAFAQHVGRLDQRFDKDKHLVMRLAGVPGEWMFTCELPEDTVAELARATGESPLRERLDRAEEVEVCTRVWRPYKRFSPRPRGTWRVSIDFDSVVHADPGKFTGCEIIEGEPNPGAISWLEGLLSDPLVEVIIHTCRFTQNDPRVTEFKHGKPEVTEGGLRAWLSGWGLSDAALARLSFWHDVGKPTADIYIDDKAFAFVGRFPTIERMQSQMRANKALRIKRGCR